MSWFTGDDGKRYEIFGAGGGQELADELGVPLLGQIPLLPHAARGRRRRPPDRGRRARQRGRPARSVAIAERIAVELAPTRRLQPRAQDHLSRRPARRPAGRGGSPGTGARRPRASVTAVASPIARRERRSSTPPGARHGPSRSDRRGDCVVDVRIGVIQAPREIALELADDTDRDALKAADRRGPGRRRQGALADRPAGPRGRRPGDADRLRRDRHARRRPAHRLRELTARPAPR